MLCQETSPIRSASEVCYLRQPLGALDPALWRLGRVKEALMSVCFTKVALLLIIVFHNQ